MKTDHKVYNILVGLPGFVSSSNEIFRMHVWFVFENFGISATVNHIITGEDMRGPAPGRLRHATRVRYVYCSHNCTGLA